MKRFYKAAEVEAGEGGYGVVLDGRPLRSPARRPLLLPTERLAQAIANEWEKQGETIDRRTMPLMRMAGTAIDDLAGHRAETADAVAGYAATDLVCYWASEPQRLVERQQAVWRPLIDWAESRFDVRFDVTTDLRVVSQPEATLAGMKAVVHALDNFRLVPLSVATGAAGSLVIGLALVHRRLRADAAFEAAQLDESFQIEEWGEDAEAAERRRNILTELQAVESFIAALDA